MTALADDVARLRQVLHFQDGPTIVVGHSYGGQIMTALGTDAPNVAGLVYIAAFGIDEGESIGALLSQGPVTPALAHLFTARSAAAAAASTSSSDWPGNLAASRNTPTRIPELSQQAAQAASRSALAPRRGAGGGCPGRRRPPSTGCSTRPTGPDQGRSAPARRGPHGQRGDPASDLTPARRENKRPPAWNTGGRQPGENKAAQLVCAGDRLQARTVGVARRSV
jgi:pimeloyl-ACP methyl ester carboxylesterase